MPEINKDLVKYVAGLARLAFDETELEDFTNKFKNILNYVEKLGELNVEDVSPTYHPMPVNYAMREDIVKKSLDVERALLNAPDRKDDFFRVPKVVD
ncbi:MAG: Asp-tRNA(Asn)/Glu-tRNA(Gln) amidotransferase subunit GatC [Proteobacteria bacterium]|nr:Asp-tRNA(Asn)/Glu-tRNA(Gln) amidotransferase subunit GatC [Pseudomonadota bacterium]